MSAPLRSSLRLRRSLPVLACVLGLSIMAAPAAGAASAATPSRSARAEAIARAAIRRIAESGAVTRRRQPGVRPDFMQVQSTSWSGYIDTGSTFTIVTGSWSEPTITCTAAATLVPFWVGLGGYLSSSVAQAGTLAECYEGTAYQYTWWQLSPTSSVQIVGDTVASGDSISALVVRGASNYTLEVTDTNHQANSFNVIEACASCSTASAEWVVEGPGGDGGYPMPHFSPWNLTQSAVAAGGPLGVIASYPDTSATMIDNVGYTLAVPGALTTSGSAFTDTWLRGS
jgi:Peptidase A4 family